MHPTRTVNPSRARRVVRLGVTSLAFALLCGACCGYEPEEGVSVAPERFVMATVTNEQGRPNHIEVRVSSDGETWSAPSYPLTIDCGIPVPIDSNISPSLGVTPSHYLIAAYDLSGELWTARSRDGVNWTPAEVATDVDADTLGPDSRPSLVYDRDERAWVAILATFDRFGRALRPYFAFLDGPVGGVREDIRDWAPRRGTAIAYTGIPGSRYVVTYTDRGNVNAAIYDGIGGDPILQPAVAMDGAQIRTGGSPWVTSTLSQVWLATSTNVDAAQPDPENPGERLARGRNEIWEYDVNAQRWDRAFFLDGAGESHEGPSVAGVRTNMVVASPGPNKTTDVWHIAPDRVDVLRAEHQVLRTRSNKPAAIVFGPKLAGGRLENVCNDGGETLDVFLRLRSFKNVIAPDRVGDFEYEDVAVEIAHKTRLDFIDREYDADPSTDEIDVLVVRDATTNQSHQFNEGVPGSSWPELRFRMQPTESVTVKLTGSRGETSVDITYDELAAEQNAGNTKVTHTRYADDSYGYQLRYDANVN